LPPAELPFGDFENSIYNLRSLGTLRSLKHVFLAPSELEEMAKTIQRAPGRRT